MQYIDYINSFWDFVTLNPLSTGQVSLYFALLHVSNRSYWTEWFTAPNQVLSVLTGLSKAGIQKARNELKQKGLIDFKERGGAKATAYKLLTANSMQDSTQTNVYIANSSRFSSQNRSRFSNQNSSQNSSTLKDIRHKTQDIRQKPPISPVDRFQEFWQAYPKKMNLLKAQEEYAYLLQTTQELTEELLITAAKNYAESCEILHTREQYIKHPSNWLKDSSWVSYLPENYRKPEAPAMEERREGQRQQSNKLNHFQQNEYDFEQLERELLSN